MRRHCDLIVRPRRHHFLMRPSGKSWMSMFACLRRPVEDYEVVLVECQLVMIIDLWRMRDDMENPARSCTVWRLEWSRNMSLLGPLPPDRRLHHEGIIRIEDQPNVCNWNIHGDQIPTPDHLFPKLDQHVSVPSISRANTPTRGIWLGTMPHQLHRFWTHLVELCPVLDRLANGKSLWHHAQAT